MKALLPSVCSGFINIRQVLTASFADDNFSSQMVWLASVISPRVIYNAVAFRDTNDSRNVPVRHHVPLTCHQYRKVPRLDPNILNFFLLASSLRWKTPIVHIYIHVVELTHLQIQLSQINDVMTYIYHMYILYYLCIWNNICMYSLVDTVHTK